jgi:hypothetical protein
MHEQRAAVDPEQQVLAAPVDALDRPAFQSLCEIGRNRPAQAAVVYPHRSDATSDHARRDTASRRLDLRELGHLTAGARMPDERRRNGDGAVCRAVGSL